MHQLQKARNLRSSFPRPACAPASCSPQLTLDAHACPEGNLQDRLVVLVQHQPKQNYTEENQSSTPARVDKTKSTSLITPANPRGTQKFMTYNRLLA